MIWIELINLNLEKRRSKETESNTELKVANKALNFIIY